MYDTTFPSQRYKKVKYSVSVITIELLKPPHKVVDIELCNTCLFSFCTKEANHGIDLCK